MNLDHGVIMTNMYKTHKHIAHGDIIEKFRRIYPKFSTIPVENGTILTGEVYFQYCYPDFEPVICDYMIRIFFPIDFPKKLPVVYEIGGAIPPLSEYHVNVDHSLCLATEYSLREIVNSNNKPLDALVHFYKKVIQPYLGKISLILCKGHSPSILEERHGISGIIDSYKTLFKVSSKSEVILILSLFSNKMQSVCYKQCPFFCKNKCEGTNCERFNKLIIKRKSLPRRFWKHELTQLSINKIIVEKYRENRENFRADLIMKKNNS